MATVTGHRPNWITAEQLTAIEAAAAELGAPLDRIFVTAETSAAERKAGKVGRAILMLADTAPGWRSSDPDQGRNQLKIRVREILPELAISVQANYSCLSVAESGMIERRDSAGKVIGVYQS